MRTREIKFRGFSKELNEWVYGDLLHLEKDFVRYHAIVDWSQKDPNVRVDGVGQYTGLKDKNGKEIYEGDIFRIEESTDDGTDFFIYVVITWVQEWCMFATLRVEDEYPGYLANGIKSLDEPMFWTYTLEDTNSRKHFLCGNIYQNLELL